jgi:hypothetical protein
MSVTIAPLPFGAPNPLRVESPTLLKLLILDHDWFVREGAGKPPRLLAIGPLLQNPSSKRFG